MRRPAGARISPGTFRARRSSTSTRISPTSRSPTRAGIRSRRRRSSPPLPVAPGSATGVFVVAYGSGGGPERLWWLLRHFGHDDCAVLLGGIEAWGGELRAGEEEIEPLEFVPRERDGDTIQADEIVARLADPSLALVDARAASRWRGEPNPIDDPPGRIPGAANAPWMEPFPEELPPGELVAYCGSACRRASRCTAPGSPAAKDASIPARGASGRSAACQSSAVERYSRHAAPPSISGSRHRHRSPCSSRSVVRASLRASPWSRRRSRTTLVSGNMSANGKLHRRLVPRHREKHRRLHAHDHRRHVRVQQQVFPAATPQRHADAHDRREGRREHADRHRAARLPPRPSGRTGERRPRSIASRTTRRPAGCRRAPAFDFHMLGPTR